jgi:hypothetical protein
VRNSPSLPRCRLDALLAQLIVEPATVEIENVDETSTCD